MINNYRVVEVLIHSEKNLSKPSDGATGKS